MRPSENQARQLGPLEYDNEERQKSNEYKEQLIKF